MESANRTHALTILIAAARDAADVKNVAAGAKSISDFTTDIDDVGVCIANAASNYIEDYQSTYIVAAQALLASLDAMKVKFDENFKEAREFVALQLDKDVGADVAPIMAAVHSVMRTREWMSGHLTSKPQRRESDGYYCDVDTFQSSFDGGACTDAQACELTSPRSANEAGSSASASPPCEEADAAAVAAHVNNEHDVLNGTKS